MKAGCLSVLTPQSNILQNQSIQLQKPLSERIVYCCARTHICFHVFPSPILACIFTGMTTNLLRDVVVATYSRLRVAKEESHNIVHIRIV